MDPTGLITDELKKDGETAKQPRKSNYWPLLCAGLIAIIMFQMFMYSQGMDEAKDNELMLKDVVPKYQECVNQHNYAVSVSKMCGQKLDQCISAYLRLYNETKLNGTMADNTKVRFNNTATPAKANVTYMLPVGGGG